LPRKASIIHREAVLSELSKGPKTWSELLAATGVSEATLYRILKALMDEGIVIKDGNKWALVADVCKNALRSRYMTPFCSLVGCDPSEALDKILEHANCEELLKGIQRYEEYLTSLAEVVGENELLKILVGAFIQNRGLVFAMALESSLLHESISTLIDALGMTRDFPSKEEVLKLLKAAKGSLEHASIRNAWEILKELQQLGYNGELKLTTLGVKVDIPLRKIAVSVVYDAMQQLGRPLIGVARFLGKATEIGFRILESGLRPLTDKEINELVSAYSEIAGSKKASGQAQSP